MKIALLFLLLPLFSAGTASAQSLDQFLYWYECTDIRVIDGDTIECDVQLGLDVSMKRQIFRLAGINAPETRLKAEREAGLASKAWLNDLVGGKDAIIRTLRDTKGRFGRYIASLFYGGENINDALVSHGHAEYRAY